MASKKSRRRCAVARSFHVPRIVAGLLALAWTASETHFTLGIGRGALEAWMTPRVAEAPAPAWEALAAVLLHHGYEIGTIDTDSYNCRSIKGTNEKSLHSYGIGESPTAGSGDRGRSQAPSAGLRDCAASEDCAGAVTPRAPEPAYGRHGRPMATDVV